MLIKIFNVKKGVQDRYKAMTDYEDPKDLRIRYPISGLFGRIAEGEDWTKYIIGYKKYPYKQYDIKHFAFSIYLYWWFVKVSLY